MKCIAAVVMMAFAVAARASYAPLVYSAAPWAYSLPHTTVVQSNTAPKLIAAPWAYAPTAYGAPLAYASAPYYTYASAPLAYSAPAVLLQKEARYLAANRGAIHEAPLPGHEISQQQLNLEPAAGTV
ncbi:AAEL002231-PA [Aedes aegypti]|uniref:AAEL002231-PA n=2 Tax=Aedes aegypti TaxID=7159 RepID=A0A1S4F129_AEDAE|nr:adult cuticle protein 1 [Aedes aegypti]EAT46620.1 AAEL002231-PA [Aedes aegypti]